MLPVGHPVPGLHARWEVVKWEKVKNEWQLPRCLLCPYPPQLWFWRIMQERWSTLKTKDLNTRKNDLGRRRRNSRTDTDDQDQKQIPLLSHDDHNHTESYVLSQDSWPAATESVWNSSKLGAEGNYVLRHKDIFPKVAEWISWRLWEGQQCRPQTEMCDRPQGEPCRWQTITDILPVPFQNKKSWVTLLWYPLLLYQWNGMCCPRGSVVLKMFSISLA